MKDKFEAEIAELSAPVDDPVFVEMAGKYMGAILYDNETRASWKIYRVTSIQFVRSYAIQRHSCWEATYEPVYRDAKNGQFIVPADQRVADSKVIKTTALQGYALAEYRESLDKPPTQLPWVQQYSDHFHNVVLPRYPGLPILRGDKQGNAYPLPPPQKTCPVFYQNMFQHKNKTQTMKTFVMMQKAYGIREDPFSPLYERRAD